MSSAVSKPRDGNVLPFTTGEKLVLAGILLAVIALIFIIVTACLADLGQKFPFGVTFGNVSRYILYSLVGMALLSVICCSCCSGASHERMRDVD